MTRVFVSVAGRWVIILLLLGVGAAPVRAEIQRLEAAIEATSTLLFEQAITAASHVPEYPPVGVVSGFMARAGFVEWAIETDQRAMTNEAREDEEASVRLIRSSAFRNYAEGLIMAGRIDQGLALLPQITEGHDRDSVWATVAQYSVETAVPPDVERARQAATHIEDEAFRQDIQDTTEHLIRDRQLDVAPPAMVTESVAPVARWRALGRELSERSDATSEQVRALAGDETATAYAVAVGLAQIAAEPRFHLWGIHALETRLAQHPATTSAPEP